jgi:type II secretory pathway pseudopilin PulG
MRHSKASGHTLLELLIVMLAFSIVGYAACLTLGSLRESRLQLAALRLQRFLEEAVITSATSAKPLTVTLSPQLATFAVTSEASHTQSLPILNPIRLIDKTGARANKSQLQLHQAEFCTPYTILLADQRSLQSCYVFISLRCRVRSICA